MKAVPKTTPVKLAADVVKLPDSDYDDDEDDDDDDEKNEEGRGGGVDQGGGSSKAGAAASIGAGNKDKSSGAANEKDAPDIRAGGGASGSVGDAEIEPKVEGNNPKNRGLPTTSGGVLGEAGAVGQGARGLEGDKQARTSPGERGGQDAGVASGGASAASDGPNA